MHFSNILLNVMRIFAELWSQVTKNKSQNKVTGPPEYAHPLKI